LDFTNYFLENPSFICHGLGIDFSHELKRETGEFLRSFKELDLGLRINDLWN
jgi:hypothetical protein